MRRERFFERLVHRHERQGIIEIKSKANQKTYQIFIYILRIVITFKINNPIPKLQMVSFVSSSRRDAPVVEINPLYPKA